MGKVEVFMQSDVYGRETFGVKTWDEAAETMRSLLLAAEKDGIERIIGFVVNGNSECEFATAQEICPYCQSSNISNEGPPNDFDMLEVDCLDCGRKWTEPNGSLARLGLGLRGEMETTGSGKPTSLDWRMNAAKGIYQAYPHSDLLSIDSPREGETICDFAVRAKNAGDTLFLFLCCEANEDIDGQEYLRRLDRALNDIGQVRNAFLARENVIYWLKTTVPQISPT